MELFNLFPVVLLIIVISINAKDNEFESKNTQRPETELILKASKNDDGLGPVAYPNTLVSKLSRKIDSLFGSSLLLANAKSSFDYNLKLNWDKPLQGGSKLSNGEKESIVRVIKAIIDNIDWFPKVKENPNEVMKAIITIITSIESNLSFSESVGLDNGAFGIILELVGMGPNSKPLIKAIEEEIEKFSKSYNKHFITKAKEAIKSLYPSKKFLSMLYDFNFKAHLLKKAKQLPSPDQIKKMSDLFAVFKGFFDRNDAKTAQIDLQNCELFAKIAVWYELILMQIMDLIGSWQGPNALKQKQAKLSYRNEFRKMVQGQFEKLYIEANQTWKYGYKHIPYFDPDVNVITDFYARHVLKLGGFDSTPPGGLYCLRHLSGKDFVWRKKQFLSDTNQPYTTITNSSNDTNCYWKLVPHGQNIYSIVNKYQCQNNSDHCGAMLSFGTIEGEKYVKIDSQEPTLWQIDHGYNNKTVRIINKSGCDTGDLTCDKELKIKTRTVGQLLQGTGKYDWSLKKV